jgi:hypothetical protein
MATEVSITDNNDTPEYTVAVSPSTLEETVDAEVVFTITRNGRAEVTGDFTWAITGVDENDIAGAISGEFQVPASDSTGEVRIFIRNDDIFEGNENLIFTLTAAAHATVPADSRTTEVTITDNSDNSGIATIDPNVLDEGNAATDDYDLELRIGGAPATSFHWEITGGEATRGVDYIALVSGDEANFKIVIVGDKELEEDETIQITFTDIALAAGPVAGIPTLSLTIINDDSVDANGNGLVDIRSTQMLSNMRHNLAGTSYKTSSAGVSYFCSDNDGTVDCGGYELMQDLDFDRDGDGLTRTGNVLDEGDNLEGAFDAASGGWTPIGSEANQFTATFDGNNNSIKNLAITGKQVAGLFGFIRAEIRNLRLEDVYINAYAPAGALAARAASDEASSSFSRIINVFTSGRLESLGGLNGGLGEGGIVGNLDGHIIASSSNVAINAGSLPGGLVGRLHDGSIIASHATGSITVRQSQAGGLVAAIIGGEIIDTYATGGIRNLVFSVTSNRIGGHTGISLPGNFRGRKILESSYATGNLAISSNLGKLVADTRRGFSVEKSYGYGIFTSSLASRVNREGTGAQDSIRHLLDATTSHSDFDTWDSGAWLFRDSFFPVLQHADYDGAGSEYSCGAEVAEADRGTIFHFETCGQRLLGQEFPKIIPILEVEDASTGGARFLFNLVDGVDTYQIQRATNSGFTGVVIDEPITTSSDILDTNSATNNPTYTRETTARTYYYRLEICNTDSNDQIEDGCRYSRSVRRTISAP